MTVLQLHKKTQYHPSNRLSYKQAPAAIYCFTSIINFVRTNGWYHRVPKFFYVTFVPVLSQILVYLGAVNLTRLLRWILHFFSKMFEMQDWETKVVAEAWSSKVKSENQGIQAQISRFYGFQTFLPRKHAKMSIQKLAVTILKNLSLVLCSKLHLIAVKV